MLHGLNLKTSGGDQFAEWLADGHALVEREWPKANRRIDTFIANGFLDGDAIKDQWFKKTKAHVFISHSHDDLDTAIGLAGFLSKKLGLVPFVDSLVWEDSRKLQGQLYAQSYGAGSGKEIDLDIYNSVTSHVHMMLATSLTAAMDSCECVMFLNTPNSMGIADAGKPQEGNVATASPWIYHELMTASVMHRQEDGRRPKLELSAESRDSIGALPAYRAPVKALIPLQASQLLTCAAKGFQGFDALDWLYSPPVKLRRLASTIRGRGRLAKYFEEHQG